MIAVVGAGAMGTALAMIHHRAGAPTALLGTRFDAAAIEACRSGRPHPALGITLPTQIDCRAHGKWGAALRNVERVLIAVSSDGLSDIVSEVAQTAHPRAMWVVATKGFDPASLRTPSELITSVVGDERRVVVLGGPALAPEIVAGAPMAMVCASGDTSAAAAVATTLRTAGTFASVTDDVAGVEIAAAYKNVTAIAVGLCEGLSSRLPESVFVHRFANARAAMFALGLRDMVAMCRLRGGRIETIVGLAGAGDLYVTCLGGRNGNFGRLLGEGQTAAQALGAIGSTVEGVPNASAALALAESYGIELPTARAVARVIAGEATPEDAIRDALATL